MSTAVAERRPPSTFGKNLVIFLAGILVAVLFEKGGAFAALINSTMEMQVFGAFVAGIFFTSFLTTVPASFALGHIALDSSIWMTALIGAAGAVLGDIALFSLVRNQVPKNWLSLMIYSQYCVDHAKVCSILPIFKHRSFKYLTPILGALVIASPIPDEIGLAMLGLSNISPRLFIPISYVMNALGIVLIGYAAKFLL